MSKNETTSLESQDSYILLEDMSQGPQISEKTIDPKILDIKVIDEKNVLVKEGSLKELSLPNLNFTEEADEKPKPLTRIWISTGVVLWLLLLSEAVRGIMVPTQAEYVFNLTGGTSMLGLTIGLFSTGRLISTIALGYLSGFLSYRTMFLSSTVLLIVGNIFYASAGIASTGGWRIYMLLFARFILGSGAATLSIIRAYLADVCTLKQRTSIMAIAAGVQYAGFAVTPFLGSLISIITRSATGDPTTILADTTPAWIMVFSNSISILLLLSLFTEPTVVPESKIEKSLVKSNSNDNLVESNSNDNLKGKLINQEQFAPLKIEETNLTPLDDSEIKESENSEIVGIPEPDEKSSAKLVKIIWFSFLIINFLIRIVLGTIETYGAPLYDDVTIKYLSPGETSFPLSSGFFFGILGVFGTILVISLAFFAKKVPDFVVFLASLITMLIGSSILIGNSSMSLVQFIVGSTFIWSLGYPLSQTVVVSMFSKIPGSSRQGATMSWIGSAGSIGRIIGPLIAGAIETQSGPAAMFGFNTAVAAIVFVIGILMIKPYFKVMATKK